MAKQYPETGPNEAAVEGEASHEVGEQLIRNATASGASPVLSVGDIATNGTVITDEMFEGAELYANSYLETFRMFEGTPGLIGGVEDRVDIYRVHRDCFGTLDSWLYVPMFKTLFVTDYKFGRLFVDPYKNKQAVCYIAGLEARLKLPKDTNVVVRIVQPRTYSGEGPIREWKTTIGGMYPIITDLSAAAHKAMSDRAELVTGPHCRYCQARHACEPALRSGIGFYEMAAAPLPVDLTPEALGLQLQIVDRAVEQLAALKTGYEEQVKATIKSGKSVPGYALKPAYGREKWTAPPEQIINLGKLLGIDVAKPGTVTPNQARKLGMDEVTISSLSTRPNNGVKLTSEPADMAARIFKGE